MRREDVQIGERYWLGDDECGMAVQIDDEIDTDHFVAHSVFGPLERAVSAGDLRRLTEWIEP